MAQEFNNVFISYASEDFKTASNLYEYLCENDYNPWLDKFKLLPGQTWDIEIRQALRRADFIILLLSNISVEKRGYVQREFRLALEYIEEKLDTDIYIIPCKIDNCEIPYKLKNYQWVSLVEKHSFDKILSSLNLQRNLYKEAERRKILSHVSFDYENIKEEYTIDSSPKSNIEIEYPQFKDTKNDSLKELNSIIEGTIINQYVGNREIIIESKYDEYALKRHTEYNIPGYSITISFEFTLLSEDFISFISNSYYYMGGAHGNYETNGFSYSLNPLRAFNIFSLTENTSILKYISETCRNYIINKIQTHTGVEENESDYFLDEEPLRPDSKNFRNFYLDKKGLNIIFNPYEVTGYAQGQHIVPIPYSDLIILAPELPILKSLIKAQPFI